MNRQVALVRGHISLLLLFVDKKLPINNYVPKILEQINSISQDDGYIPTLKILADGLFELLTHSDSFNFGEYLMLDLWFIKYLSTSSSSEHDRLLDCMNSCLIKAPDLLCGHESNKHIYEMLAAIYKYLLPYVKQIFLHKDVSHSVPELAANLCLCAGHIPGGQYSFDDLFKYFSDSNCGNSQ